MSAEVDTSQAANPRTYQQLAAHAAYQVESLAMALRDFALAHDGELDIFAISTSARLRQLAGVQMTLAQGSGTPDDVETVWGGTIDAFAASLQPALIEGDAVARVASEAA